MDTRMNRRIFGMLSKRLDEAGLDEVEDGRDDRGKRWRLGSLLRAVIGGMLAGSKSLADVETLSTRLSRPMRGLLGVQRRLPDTTLRSALCTVEPWRLMPALHALVRQAQRRKALEPDQRRPKTSSAAKRSCAGSSSDRPPSSSTAGPTCAPCCASKPRRSMVRPVSCGAKTSAISSRAYRATASPLSIGSSSLESTGASRRLTKFSTPLSPRTTTLGSKPILAQLWSSRSCAALLTPCFRSTAASHSAPASAAPRRGRR